MPLAQPRGNRDRSSSGDANESRVHALTSGAVPVFVGDFADPFVLQVGRSFDADATSRPLRFTNGVATLGGADR